jgi:dTDP-4-dehydrorhamnose reductase
MKKILITGSNGQLGKELLIQLLNLQKYKLILTDIDTLDISNIDEVNQELCNSMPDIVINCAAFTAVDLCEDEPEKAYQSNAIGAKNLAIVSELIGAKIIQISTDYVFDGNSNVPYIETSKPNPQSAYGKTKLAGELFVQQYNPQHFIVRTAWLYGDGNNFVKTMLKLSETRKQLKVVNDQFGSPTSTKELAKAMIQLIDSDKYGIYHATCEGYCSWYDFAIKIFEVKEIMIDVTPCTSDEYPQKANRPKFSVLENRKLKEEFDFYFKNWDEALIEYLR